jgi:hypothetical protein
MFDIIDGMLDGLIGQGFIPDEDIAWVALTQDQMDEIASLPFICPIRNVDCLVYRDVEFRVSPWARAEHKLHPVWNITKRTKDHMQAMSNANKQCKEKL